MNKQTEDCKCGDCADCTLERYKEALERIAGIRPRPMQEDDELADYFSEVARIALKESP